MALPAIADLRHHYADAHLAIAARPPVAPLFTMVKGVDELDRLAGPLARARSRAGRWRV